MVLAVWESSPREAKTGVESGMGSHCQPLPQGKIGDRVGFFPANFVQRVRPGESVWRCCRPLSGNKEQGYLSLRENQVSCAQDHSTGGERQGRAGTRRTLAARAPVTQAEGGGCMGQCQSNWSEPSASGLNISSGPGLWVPERDFSPLFLPLWTGNGSQVGWYPAL